MTVLTRFQPTREFSTLQDRINRLFHDSFSDGQEALNTSSFAPAVDVYEDEHSIVLKLEVPGIDGPINVKIPEGTQSGKELRIRGRGVPYLSNKGTGDLVVKVLVQIPRKLSRAQRDLVTKLAESLSVDNKPTSPGLLDMMKDLFN